MRASHRRSFVFVLASSIVALGACSSGNGGSSSDGDASDTTGSDGDASPIDAVDSSDAGTASVSDARCSEGGAPSRTFDDDFSAGLGAASWTVSQTTANLFTVDTTHGDIRLAKAATNLSSAVQNVAVTLNLAMIGGPVAGDFEFNVDFTNAVIGPSGTDQVELHAYFEDMSFFFDVYDNSSGSGTINAHVWTGSIHAGFPTTVTGGTLRIARVGSTLSAYLNSMLVYSMASSSSPLSGIDFVLQLQPGSNDNISVQYDNFHFQAGCVSQ